ncbi:MAG: hypothetical protein C4562_03980 [Actinobacteria bacterium]|nr:MAG: hypothetical protein C4562_03980 [Actinomycetota bacterium]
MAYFLIVLAVILRLVPHMPNFAPIAALALFGGAYLNKKWAIIIPLAAMFISDLYIGTYSWKIMASVYISFALVGLIGMYIRNHKNIFTVAGGALSGSLLFFVITNFAVWAFGSMYTHNLSGLFSCYTAAIPFFRATLAGDVFYTTAFFGSYELVALLARKREEAKLETSV